MINFLDLPFSSHLGKANQLFTDISEREKTTDELEAFLVISTSHFIKAQLAPEPANSSMRLASVCIPSLPSYSAEPCFRRAR